MARRGGGVGCGFAAVTLLVAVVAGPTLFSLPTLMTHAVLADESRFRAEALYWGIAEVVAALLALALVAVVNHGGMSAGRVIRRGSALFVATALASYATYLYGVRGHDPPDLRYLSVAPLFSAAGAAVVVLGFWWIRDGAKRRAPVERVEPVTVDEVRRVTKQAEQSLRQVRVENDRIERLLRDLEAKLAAARLELGFEGLRQLHRESRGYADHAHGRYRTHDRILDRMTRTNAGAQVTLRRTARRDRSAFVAATAGMVGTEGRLRAEVERGRSMVSTLNQRTETLKYRIRDECGARGEYWYDDLVARRDAARAAEGRGHRSPGPSGGRRPAGNRR